MSIYFSSSTMSFSVETSMLVDVWENSIILDKMVHSITLKNAILSPKIEGNPHTVAPNLNIGPVFQRQGETPCLLHRLHMMGSSNSPLSVHLLIFWKSSIEGDPLCPVTSSSRCDTRAQAPIRSKTGATTNWSVRTGSKNVVFNKWHR